MLPTPRCAAPCFVSMPRCIFHHILFQIKIVEDDESSDDEESKSSSSELAAAPARTRTSAQSAIQAQHLQAMKVQIVELQKRLELLIAGAKDA